MVRTNYRQPLFLVIIDIIPGHYLPEMSIRRYATLSSFRQSNRALTIRILSTSLKFPS